jgi:hypothetical protein
MNIKEFKEKLTKLPTQIAFSETMAVIDKNYDFTPTAFQNGETYNNAGENSGSCKLFSFAQLQQFTAEEILACFGSYYFDDVLKNPEKTDHQNIRNFIKTGWDGISFKGEALKAK